MFHWNWALVFLQPPYFILCLYYWVSFSTKDKYLLLPSPSLKADHLAERICSG